MVDSVRVKRAIDSLAHDLADHRDAQQRSVKEMV
jgi:hypothetical protein